MSIIRALRNRPFIFFTIILLIKGALAWFVVFDDGPSWETIVTEIPFFWIIFCLIEWFASKRKFLYYMAVNLVITFLYFAVLMYYKYYGIIVTYHALNQADKVTQVGESTYSLMDPYYLLIFVDIIIIGMFMVRPKTIAKLKSIGMNKRINRRLLSGAFVLSVALCIFSIWPNHASMNELKKAEGMGILNYEVYTIFADSTQEEELIDQKDITQDAINQLKGIKDPAAPAYFGADKGKNLIIIQMESFQNFLIDLKIDGKEITPNVNKLARENFHYDNFYTNVGAGTTSDAEFTVNTSLYVPQHEPAIQHYADKALPSLPKLLGDAGYNTATFHTNEISFWNRTELYKALGWQKYYDKKFYGDDDHVAFSASDEVLFDKTLPVLKEMDQNSQPFYAMVISQSAHHPFNIPERKYKMELPERYEGTFVGDYIRSQNYADWALGQFVDQLKASGLWDNSVVLFYGDHQGVSLYALDNKEKDLMHEILGRDYGYTDMFNIPLILHAPGVTYPDKIQQMGAEIDVMPTVANLLGVSMANQIHFGQDLLNQDTNLVPMRHFLPTGSFINDTRVFLPGISYEDGTNYSVFDNSESATGTTEQQYDNALKLLNMSDSYVKQLPDKDEKIGPADGSLDPQ
ncbi:LTA synthase family protein [Cohnella lubricantis]|uniref:LTA synthase family protein n=1 Tax=Cohnella lubricantis TaxID=2163172 RepID=A0A841TG14_9BACL|nr:LTA synthase family protein [Cohnella lubricantis]MBB6679296.1 LTA synthase family protein [Cohnella lubricantis]MBP2120395.1 phosphoglycerol transferase MdoB-like AlkP superfamily enzyme [Cohnella lubricantis]